MEIAATGDVPVLAVGLFFTDRRHIDSEVLEQILLPIHKYPPHMLQRPPTGLPATFVEAEGDVAHMTIADGRSAGLTDTLKWMNRTGCSEALRVKE